MEDDFQASSFAFVRIQHAHGNTNTISYLEKTDVLLAKLSFLCGWRTEM